MSHHLVGRLRWMNCLWAALLLLLTGRLRTAFVRARGNCPFFHVYGVTRNGNMIHFREFDPFDRGTKLWFPGRFQVISQRLGKRAARRRS